MGDAVELRLAQQTAVKALRVDLSLFGKQPFGQLLFGHLEAEDRNRLLAFKSRVQTDVESERGVVHQDVLSDEVVGVGHCEVIDLVLAGAFNRDDLVPVDVVARDLSEADLIENLGVGSQPRGGQTSRRVRVESPYS